MAEKATGEVKWFNPEKGYGFIKAKDGKNVFVAGSKVSEEQQTQLTSGKPVEFTLINDERGTFAEDIKVQA